MKLNELEVPQGSRKSIKRVGRGDGSGLGKTCGRGHKGQKARSGGGVRPGFEGGQMPLIRRVPKRGFTNIFKKQFSILNIGQLEQFEAGEVVSLELLESKGLIRSLTNPVKLLGSGDLSKKITVQVHAASASAQDKLQKAGGTLEIVAC